MVGLFSCGRRESSISQPQSATLAVPIRDMPTTPFGRVRIVNTENNDYLCIIGKMMSNLQILYGFL